MANVFPLKIGRFECLVIKDGLLTVGPCKVELGCLIIKTGQQTILVDSGCGVSVQVEAGKLVDNMTSEGLDVSDIDLVVHTHGHSDHIGGNFSRAGEITFSKARHMIHLREWGYWEQKVGETGLSGTRSPMVASAGKNLLPLKDRIDYFEKNKEILSGISWHFAPGHTPGNIYLKLSSQGDQLICIGDLIHDPAEFENPHLYSMIDFFHDMALRSREEVVLQAAREHKLVWACHFPFPGVGYIIQKGNLFAWEPVTL